MVFAPCKSGRLAQDPALLLISSSWAQSDTAALSANVRLCISAAVRFGVVDASTPRSVHALPAIASPAAYCMLSSAPEHDGCCRLLRPRRHTTMCCIRVAARDPRQRGRAPRRPLRAPNRLSCLHAVPSQVHARHAASRMRRAAHVDARLPGTNWHDCPKATMSASLGRRHDSQHVGHRL